MRTSTAHYKTRSTAWNLRPKLTALLVASCFAGESSIGLANPTGPTVAAGSASFATAGNLFTITNSSNAIINWQAFSIGGNEITKFIQPSALSAVLNRVTGAGGVIPQSVIEGILSSNGRVFLLNPSGVVFGAGARIDVAGLVTSSLNLSNDDFLAGKLRFAEVPGAGGVINQGVIDTPAFGRVYLIAPKVENSGIIRTPQGEIILAAGTSVELVSEFSPYVTARIRADVNEAKNLGSLIADAGRIGVHGAIVTQAGTAATQASVGPGGEIRFVASKELTVGAGSSTSASGATGGRVVLQAEGGDNLIAGTVEAKGSAGKGGEIQALGVRVGVIGAGVIDASGETGGGSVLVGGDFQGRNASVQNAQKTYIGRDGVIRADAGASGDGGKVVVWADGSTAFYGNISARGGSRSGNGGNVEVSGKENLAFRGKVDARAPNGRTGTLLLDPVSLVIEGGSGDGDSNASNGTIAAGAGSGFFSFGETASVLYESEIEGQSVLTNITLQATSGISVGNQPFTNNSGNPGDTGNGTLALAGGQSLTLQTRNNGSLGDVGGAINLRTGAHGANLTIVTSGCGSITVETGVGGNYAANIALPNLVAGTGGVSVNSYYGGSITIRSVTTAQSGMPGGEVVINSGGGTDPVTVNALIDTRGGDSAYGGGYEGGCVSITGSTVQLNSVNTSGGNALAGTGGQSGGEAGFITLNANTLTVSGNIFAQGGDGESPSSGYGGAAGGAGGPGGTLDLHLAGTSAQFAGNVSLRGGSGGAGVDVSSPYGGAGGIGGEGGGGGKLNLYFSAAGGSVSVNGKLNLSGGAGGDGGDTVAASWSGGAGGAGGDGGSVGIFKALTTTGDIAFHVGDMVAFGGRGGAGGNSTLSSGGAGGIGGDGGWIQADFDAYGGNVAGLTISGSMDLRGGDGGNGGAGGGSGGVGGQGGQGGGGGAIYVYNIDTTSRGDITISSSIDASGGMGGKGGDAADENAGNGGAGGAGGEVYVFFAASGASGGGGVTISGPMTLKGGSGGAGGNAGTGSGDGGAGGDGGDGGYVHLGIYDSTIAHLTFSGNIAGAGGQGGAGGNSTLGNGGKGGNGGDGATFEAGEGSGNTIGDISISGNLDLSGGLGGGGGNANATLGRNGGAGGWGGAGGYLTSELYDSTLGNITISGSVNLAGADGGSGGSGGPGSYHAGAGGEGGAGGTLEIYATGSNLTGEVSISGSVMAYGGAGGDGGSSLNGAGYSGGPGGDGGTVEVSVSYGSGLPGGITISGPIDLSGGRGGSGGTAFAVGKPGGHGGAGGDGGTLTISAYYIQTPGDVTVSGGVTAFGGDGGYGGDAGYGGSAGSGGNGGAGGEVWLYLGNSELRDVKLSGTLNLNGGNAGDAGSGEKYLSSGNGGSGSSGGSLGIYLYGSSARDVSIAEFSARGGFGGNGSISSTGYGGIGGGGGAGGFLGISGGHGEYVDATLANVTISGTLDLSGGAGGAGGNGVSAFKYASNGGHGGRGGNVDVDVSYSTVTGAVTIGGSISVKGGSGGTGGDVLSGSGGSAGAVGAGGSGGSGGQIAIYAYGTQGAPGGLTISGTFDLSGGNGGAGGSVGGGGNGGSGGDGGDAGFIGIQAGEGIAVLTLSDLTISGNITANGGSGGSGGSSASGYAGNGGDGGEGGVVNVNINSAQVRSLLISGTMDLNGGSGGAAGSGRGAPSSFICSPYCYYVPPKGGGGDAGDGGSVTVNASRTTIGGDATITGTITARGAAGGQGASSAYGGGPGGHGGSGGSVAFWGQSGYSNSYAFSVGNVTISGALDLSGNSGGAGGNAGGAGLSGGSGGRGGSGGLVQINARGPYASAGDLKVLADVTAPGGSGGAGGNSTNGPGGWSGGGGEGGPGGGRIVVDVYNASQIGSIAMSGNFDLNGADTANAGNAGGGYSGGSAGMAGSGGFIGIYAFNANVLGDVTLDGMVSAHGGSGGAGGSSADGGGGWGGFGGPGGYLTIDRSGPYGGSGGNVFALASMDFHSGAGGAGGSGTAGYGGGLGGMAGYGGYVVINSNGGSISLGDAILNGAASGNSGAGGSAYFGAGGADGGTINLNSYGGPISIGMVSMSGGAGGAAGDSLSAGYGGYGGAGGMGGAAGEVVIDNAYTLAGIIARGGAGGRGGNATLGDGGAGGAGGDGLSAGIALTGGPADLSGGNGGAGGSTASGNGGAGGAGGNAGSFTIANAAISDAIANGGNGGAGGSSLDGTGGYGGDGGAAGVIQLMGVASLGNVSSVGGSGGLGGAGTVATGAPGYATEAGSVVVSAPGSLDLNGNIFVAAGAGNDGYGGLVQLADGMLLLSAAGSITQTDPAATIQVDNLQIDVNATGNVNLNSPSNIIMSFSAGLGYGGAVPGSFSLVTNSIGLGAGLQPQGNVIATGDVVLKNPFADGTLGAGIVQSTLGAVTLVADNLSIGGEISSPTSVTWTTANDRTMGATQALFDAISAPTVALGGAGQTQNIALLGAIDFTGSATTTLALISAGAVYQPGGTDSLTVQNFVAKGGSASFTGTNNVANLQMQASAGDAVFYNETDLKLSKIDAALPAGASATGTLFLSSGGTISGAAADAYYATGAQVLLGAGGAIGSAATPLQVSTPSLSAVAASGINIATNQFSPALVTVDLLENTTSGDIALDAYGGLLANFLVVNDGGSVSLMTHSPLSVLGGISSAGNILLSSSGAPSNDIKLDGVFTYMKDGEFVVNVGPGGNLVLATTFDGVITVQTGGQSLEQLFQETAGSDSTVSQSLNSIANANEDINNSVGTPSPNDDVDNSLKIVVATQGEGGESGDEGAPDEDDRKKKQREKAFGACKP